jgi:uncharacterized protein with GYD domain
MPMLITLYKWTDQGVRNVKGSPDRVAAATKAAEALGMKLLGIWWTMGEYDLVSVAETPDDATGTAFALGLAAQGNVRTTTMKAFTMEEFAEILKKIP